MVGASEVVIKATGARLGYGRRIVLNEVCLEVHKGQFWFFVGPNAQGKTTLLKAILRRLRPQAGRIWMDRQLARGTHVGFVPQRCDWNPILPTTVREFVELGLVGIPTTGKDRAERLAWALAHVGLSGMEKRDYWTLSGGQRQ